MELEINEKVELLFEKIRIYFYYWLENASMKMELSFLVLIVYFLIGIRLLMMEKLS